MRTVGQAGHVPVGQFLSSLAQDFIEERSTSGPPQPARHLFLSSLAQDFIEDQLRLSVGIIDARS